MTTDLKTKAAELLEIIGKATPGPWHLSRTGPHVRKENGELVTACHPFHYEQSCFDAYAIAKLPDLAACLREALQEIERLQGVARSVAGQTNDQWAHDSLHANALAVSAFTGRRTARNDPSIPTDAGVPPRDEQAALDAFTSIVDEIEREPFEDEDRLSAITRNGPTGDHYRAIGFPEPMRNDYPLTGDAQGGGE